MNYNSEINYLEDLKAIISLELDMIQAEREFLAAQTSIKAQRIVQYDRAIGTLKTLVIECQQRAQAVVNAQLEALEDEAHEYSDYWVDAMLSEDFSAAEEIEYIQAEIETDLQYTVADALFVEFGNGQFVDEIEVF